MHRLPGTEALLCNKPITQELFEQAGVQAATEVKPLSDVRGSSTYRLQLVKNALPRCAYNLFAKRNSITIAHTSTAVGTAGLRN